MNTSFQVFELVMKKKTLEGEESTDTIGGNILTNISRVMNSRNEQHVKLVRVFKTLENESRQMLLEVT